MSSNDKFKIYQPEHIASDKDGYLGFGTFAEAERYRDGLVELRVRAKIDPSFLLATSKSAKDNLRNIEKAYNQTIVIHPKVLTDMFLQRGKH